MAKKRGKKAAAKLKRFKVNAKRDLAIAKKKFVNAEKKTKEYIHKHPERAAAIAAGVGAAIGLAVGAALKKTKKKKK